MSDYPPEPWRLQGGLYASVWRVLGPVPTIPPGTQTVELRRGLLLVTAFAQYRPGGDLAYSELLSGWVVRRGLRPGLCIDRIWVDDEASMAGGRALWAIPKQMAVFDGLAVKGIARADFRPAGGPPGRWPLSGWTMQPAEDGLKQSRIRAAGRVRLAAADWDFDAKGPLGFLAGARPLVSGMLDPMRIRFGG